jgi:hypothetical protein
VVLCWADVETVGGMRCPQRLCRGVVKDKSFRSKRRQWGFVKIECAVEFLICRNGWIAAQKTKQVKGEFDLREKLVSQLEGAEFVDCAKCSNKLLFECCNSAFSHVDAVIVGGDKLDVHFICADVFFNGL